MSIVWGVPSERQECHLSEGTQVPQPFNCGFHRGTGLDPRAGRGRGCRHTLSV